MKLSRISVAYFLLILACTGTTYQHTAGTTPQSTNSVQTELVQKNTINAENGFPFYIIRNHVYLYQTPSHSVPFSHQLISLTTGDIVFPITPLKKINEYILVKTIHDETGWLNITNGIALDCDGDENLYFFSDKQPNYYLSVYRENNGEINDSYKIILYKNIIPMLLGNYTTDGWFFPVNPELAVDLAEHAVTIAKDQDTFFYATTMFDNWRINEYVIAMNLLADSYYKAGMLEKAAEIHKLLIKKYFWKRADNTQIGGLNSIVKLEKIYLDLMQQQEKYSDGYEQYKNLIIENILRMDDKVNYFTLMDNEWHLTAAEWLLNILQKQMSSQDFIGFCDILMQKTSSSGYADLVLVYKAIELYKSGEQEKAMAILTSIKAKDHMRVYLNINDWMSDKRIIPDSVIYQYDRF